MPVELLNQTLSWQGLLLVLLLFGFAPGLILRLALWAYPRDHPDRAELLGEYYAVPFHDRPLFVAAGCERALCDGLTARVSETRQRRAVTAAVRHTVAVSDDALITDAAVGVVTVGTAAHIARSGSTTGTTRSAGAVEGQGGVAGAAVELNAAVKLSVGGAISVGGGLSGTGTLSLGGAPVQPTSTAALPDEPEGDDGGALGC